MSLVDARSVGHLGDRVAIGVGAMVNRGQCIQRYVLIVTLNARCPLNPEKIDQSIAVPATRK